MNSQHQNLDTAVSNPDNSDLHAQFSTLSNYERCPNGYPSTSFYLTKPPGLTISRIDSQCSSYRSDHKTCGIIGSHTKLSSSQELNVSSIHEHTILPAVKFVQAKYDEMPEYEITAPKPFPLETQYAENPSLTYGYVSETSYGMPSSSVNITSYSPRPVLFDDNLNGSDAAIALEAGSRMPEGPSDFQIRMSQVTLNPMELGQHMRNSKDQLLDDTASDICSTMRWRDPNLSEVISFLTNPNNAIKANAAAYLQHLCYMDDPNKQRTRVLGGIPPLIRLVSYDVPDIYKNACGALRNLSYGRQNDENKRAIKDAGGITALVGLLCRTTESEVKELVTGILWNMSSCEDIKRSIIDEALFAVVSNIIKPHSGWDPVCPGDTCFSTVFRNASGVLRNVSSAGEYARTRLRDSEHLVECLLYVIKTAIEKNNIGNKTVENCVCILRNLSYRCQEVEDPNYDKQIPVTTDRTVSPNCKGENLGCFGTSKKKKDSFQNEHHLENVFSTGSSKSSIPNNASLKGYEQLWQPEVVQYYLALLQSCSNPETLEAAAGAIQNLAACYWLPSIDIRATVRKEKGLPILVELLRMEVDRVVCAVATALRNLAIDHRNKELIGKYAMRDLVQKLPSGNQQHDQNTSDDTISAVLATINEVMKKNPEFSRSLLDAGGVERLMNITRQRHKYSSCVLKFASQVLYTMWQHHELRDVYKKNGWKEQDFITKLFPVQYNTPNSPNNANNTLNRPMASQGGTRYEDRTIQRAANHITKNIDSEALTIRKESAMCGMDDDISNEAVGSETCQRGSHNTATAIYIPVVDSKRNISH